MAFFLRERAHTPAPPPRFHNHTSLCDAGEKMLNTWIHWMPWSFAAVKAVIIAKFILIGRAIHFAESYHAKPLIWETAYRCWPSWFSCPL
jgi:hypothetical protein